MTITLILHLTGHDLTFEKYSSIDVNLRGKEVHINATNTEGGLAFLGVHKEIRRHQGDEEPFAITIKQGEEEETFDDMAVDYYLNAGGETLHFGKRQG